MNEEQYEEVFFLSPEIQFNFYFNNFDDFNVKCIQETRHSYAKSIHISLFWLQEFQDKFLYLEVLSLRPSLL